MNETQEVTRPDFSNLDIREVQEAYIIDALSSFGGHFMGYLAKALAHADELNRPWLLHPDAPYTALIIHNLEMWWDHRASHRERVQFLKRDSHKEV